MCLGHSRSQGGVPDPKPHRFPPPCTALLTAPLRPLPQDVTLVASVPIRSVVTAPALSLACRLPLLSCSLPHTAATSVDASRRRGRRWHSPHAIPADAAFAAERACMKTQEPQRASCSKPVGRPKGLGECLLRGVIPWIVPRAGLRGRRSGIIETHDQSQPDGRAGTPAQAEAGGQDTHSWATWSSIWILTWAQGMPMGTVNAESTGETMMLSVPGHATLTSRLEGWGMPEGWV